MPTKQKSGLYRSKVKIGVDPSGKNIYKWISGKTQRELEDERRRVIAYYIDDTALRESQQLGSYASEWFKVKILPNLSPSSLEAYRTALNTHILPVLGNRNLRAIRSTDLQYFLNKFAGSSETKITMIMATLKGIFQAACMDRILDHDPTRYLSKPNSAPVSKKRIPTTAERERLEIACRQHKHGAYLAAMYYLGTRPGEARGLMWGDFDWEQNLVHIQRDIDYKNGGKAGPLKTAASDRWIPIPEPLRTILWPHRGLPNAYLFVGEVSGEPLSKTTSERIWLDLMCSCDMVNPLPEGANRYAAHDIRSKFAPVITPHALRHNYITMCWENGIDPYTTMRLVGHTSIKTTMDIYTHLSSTQMNAAALKIEEMFSNKSCTEVALSHPQPEQQK